MTCDIITTVAGEPWNACVNPARGHGGDHDFSRRLYPADPELGIAGPERPWEHAVVGERWSLTQGKHRETQVWVAQTGGAWRSESGLFWLLEDEDLAAIHAGVPAGPVRCREAYPGSLAWGAVTECAKSARHWKHQNTAGDLAWHGPKLTAAENAEADRIRDLGGIDRAKTRAYADNLRRQIAEARQKQSDAA